MSEVIRKSSIYAYTKSKLLIRLNRISKSEHSINCFEQSERGRDRCFFDDLGSYMNLMIRAYEIDSREDALIMWLLCDIFDVRWQMPIGYVVSVQRSVVATNRTPPSFLDTTGKGDAHVLFDGLITPCFIIISNSIFIYLNWSGRGFVEVCYSW